MFMNPTTIDDTAKKKFWELIPGEILTQMEVSLRNDDGGDGGRVDGGGSRGDGGGLEGGDDGGGHDFFGEDGV